MLKRCFIFGVLAYSAALFAAAGVVAVGNTRNGYPLIVPQVKTLKPASGTFPLPRQLTVAAPETLDLAPLAGIYTRTVPQGALLRTGDARAACRFELTGDSVPASPEGYTLRIAPEGITVRARDVRGLFYGMHSLGWMLRNRNAADHLKCCFITDWPDLELRGLYHQLAYVSPDRVDRICHVMDVLASLKYNMLLVAFFDNFPYENSPFTGRKKTYSRDDIAKIMAAAKRNHIELVPKLQVISHAGWMRTHRDWPKFSEGSAKKPHVQLYCPAHPEVLPVVEKMIRETADLLKPRYFHLGLDEILFGGYPMCPKCKAGDPSELILNHVRPLKKLLDERGIQTIVYQDEFFGGDNLNTRNGTVISRVPEGLGKDVMINSWEYGAHPSRQIGDGIRKRGFKDLIYMSFAEKTENCQNLPRIAHQLNAKGNVLAYWSIVPPTLDRHDSSEPEFYPSTIAQANYSWNANDIGFSRIPIDSANILRELLDGEPERHFRGRPAPVALSKLYNTGIGDDPMFPRLDAKLIAEIARIAAADRAKFQLATANGRLGAIVLSGTPDDGRPVQPVRIPIDTTASGASFLVTAAAFNNYGLANLKGGLPVGELEVVYADGKRAELPLVAFRNLNDWNSYLGGNACRAVLRGNDRNGALFSFYAIDWRNPRPQSAIKEIVFASNGKSLLAPALLALSLSDAGAVPAGAPGAPEFAVATERRPAKTAIIADFSRGMPKSWSRLANGVPGYRAKIVDDPERGKVLEIDIPGTAKPLSRAGIDLPLNDPCDFKNIAFDIRVSDFDSVFRADFYVMNRQATNVMGILGYAPFLGDNWQTVCLARERFVPKEGGGIDPAKANRIRIGFFLHGGIRPTKIRIAKVYFSDRMLPGRCNKLIPGK